MTRERVIDFLLLAWVGIFLGLALADYCTADEPTIRGWLRDAFAWVLTHQ